MQTQTLYLFVIHTTLEQIQQHPDFVIQEPLERLAETLCRGFAVTAIQYKGSNLKVWHMRGKLMITPTHTIQELCALRELVRA